MSTNLTHEPIEGEHFHVVTDTSTWEIVVGLEVHCELATVTKLFCGCPNMFGDEPNTNVCPVCLGLPGSLPVLNHQVVELAMRLGRALHCSVEPSVFARKNYFYPDMPKDYQVSQFDRPINVDGWLDLPDGTRVGIERAHIEEDTGKNTHAGGSGRIHGADYSLVDYNRAGVPLVEIVGRPHIRHPEQAKAYIDELRAILLATGASDAKMEEGSLRVDANVSVRRVGDPELGRRCEIKNLNSLRSLGRAIEYEARRQVDLLETGVAIRQETRHWDEAAGRTRPGRSKEEAEDYRYFPEPDLVPVVPDSVWIEELRATLPEKPSTRRKRLQNEWSVPDKEMTSLVNAGLLDVVEETISLGAEPARARSWWLGEISRLANEKEVDPTSLITASQVAEVIKLIESGELTDKLARQIVEGVIAGEGNPAEVIASRGLKVVSDDGALMTAIESAIAAQPDTADRIRGGNIPAAGALIGAVMKATGGQADAAKVRELLLKHLGQGE